MEDHFHAAVLLVCESLIEIGAVSEISAAVGDEERGVDLLLLDELGQRLGGRFWFPNRCLWRKAKWLNRQEFVIVGWCPPSAPMRQGAVFA
jgi:hypothetical protein